MNNKFKAKLVVRQPLLLLYKLKTFSVFNNSNIKFNDSKTFLKEELIVYNNSRKFGFKKSVCYAADSNLYFDIYGDVFLCCYNRYFKLGNIKKETIEEIWNGENRKQAIEAFKNNDLIEGCQLCYNEIKQKNTSSTMALSFDLYSIGKIDLPKRIDFELSNVCNLECIMCNGNFSNLIRKNREKIEAVKNPYDRNFEQQILPFLKNLEYANFMGGEPQLINVYYFLWNELIKLNKALIRVQTNATTVQPKFKELIEKNDTFQIALSIDSLEKKTFEKIRKNGNFETYYLNILYYIDLYKKNKIDLIVSICPMIDNRNEILSIIDFFSNQNIEVNINHFYSPFYLSLSNDSLENILSLERSLENYIKTKTNEINKKTILNFINETNNIKNIVIENEIKLQQYIMTDSGSLLDLIKENTKYYFQNKEINFGIIENILLTITLFIKNFNENKKIFILSKILLSKTETKNHEFDIKDLNLYTETLKENLSAFGSEYTYK